MKDPRRRRTKTRCFVRKTKTRCSLLRLLHILNRIKVMEGGCVRREKRGLLGEVGQERVSIAVWVICVTVMSQQNPLFSTFNIIKCPQINYLSLDYYGLNVCGFHSRHVERRNIPDR